MQILTTIPIKKAKMVRIPAEKPEITGTMSKPIIRFGDFEVPVNLKSDFLILCDAYAPTVRDLDTLAVQIQQAATQKEIYIRFAGDKPLGAVSGKFQEIDLGGLADNVKRITGTNPSVRYAPKSERVLLNFPVNHAFRGLNLTFDSGEYGTYNGSGSCAGKYGLAWDLQVNNAWTLFLSGKIDETQERAIHLKGDKLEQRLNQIIDYAPKLQERVEKSKGEMFSPAEVKEYLKLYSARGINQFVRAAIEGVSVEPVSAYGLSIMLSTAAAKLKNPSDSTRLRLEYLSGEAMLCYAKIKEELDTASKKQ